MLNPFFLVISSLVLNLPIETSHACGNGEKLVFACTIAKNAMHVQVCDAGADISYSYGKPRAKPELFFSVPRSQATTHQWDGMGELGYHVNIHSNKIEYTVFMGITEVDGYPELVAGIHVFDGEDWVSTSNCDTSTLEHNLIDIDLSPRY